MSNVYVLFSNVGRTDFLITECATVKYNVLNKKYVCVCVWGEGTDLRFKKRYDVY